MSSANGGGRTFEAAQLRFKKCNDACLDAGQTEAI